MQQTQNTTNKLKIAQVIGNPHGGVMSCVMNYFRHIDRTKVQFDFFLYEPSRFDDEIRALGGNVFLFPNVFKPGVVKVLKNLFLQNGYNAVHAHMTTRSGAVLKAAKAAKVSVRICHAHSTSHIGEGLGFWAKVFLKPFAVKHATHLAGCGQKSISWMFGKNASKAFLMPNAIDLSTFSPAEKTSANKTIGFVGRFVPQKNLPFLIKVFGKVCKMRSDVSLCLVGDGKQKQKLKKLAQRLAPNKVNFVGETENVHQLFCTFNLFVMTSKFEGLPLVAVEAQACGVKCLLSSEITNEANLGGAEFLPLGNATVWAEKICQMLQDDARFDAGQSLQNFDIAIQAPKLLQFYQQICVG